MNSIYRTLIAVTALLVSAMPARAIVYSVDGLIDENRMATDKMYYDLYYNPRTKLFWRSDLKTLSPEAIAILEKATESKVDRADSAGQAARSEYNRGMTGTNNCSSDPMSDPYIGSGTDVNPEIQSPEQPRCTSGGAVYADDSMGYVYMIEGAYETFAAKEVQNSYRTKKYNNPVPRAFGAPTSDRAFIGEKYTVHDSGNIVWRDGVPAGLDAMNWTGNCPGGYNPQTGNRCFDVVNDGVNSVLHTNTASWANRATTAQSPGEINFDRLTIKSATYTLNQDRQGRVQSTTYNFLIDNYTITKSGVMFCSLGSWINGTYSFTGVSDMGSSVEGDFCGGSFRCVRSTAPTGCNEKDKDGKCVKPTYDYSCDVSKACYNSNFSCASRYSGPITVSNQPVTISIDVTGTDLNFEPKTLNSARIEAEARAQLPGLVKVRSGKRDHEEIPIKDVTKCNGTPDPGNWGPCF